MNIFFLIVAVLSFLLMINEDRNDNKKLYLLAFVITTFLSVTERWC
jgi:hypothetical protein